MSEPTRIGVEESADGLVILTLDAPQRLNPIEPEGCAVLLGHVDRLSAQPATRVVLLRGAGNAFSGGGDVATIREGLADPPRLIGGLIDVFHRLILAMKRAPFPIVSVVRGAAAGGGLSLALACDLVIASRSAKLMVAYPKLGTSTDGGLSWTLTQRIGALRALDLMLLRSSLGADEALALGLVSRVVDDAALDDEALAVARQLIATAPQSVRELKHLVVAGETSPLPAQLDAERAAFLRCASTADFTQRVEAFLAKPR